MRDLLCVKQGHCWILLQGLQPFTLESDLYRTLLAIKVGCPWYCTIFSVSVVNNNRPPVFTCSLVDQCSIWRLVLTSCGRWQRILLRSPQCVVIMIDIPSRHLIELRVFNQHRYWGPFWPHSWHGLPHWLSVLSEHPPPPPGEMGLATLNNNSLSWQ